MTDDGELAEIVAELVDQPEYALDTEFHRERTYYPRLALVQLAWGDSLVLVDPLEVDITALAPVLEGDGTCVLHAASQDLEVLEVACGAIPTRIFDTQLASGFCGLGQPSLSDLHERLLHKVVPKGNRLTDWLRRPLTGDQIRYAASDVADLLTIAAMLREDLAGRGRLGWVEDECELARSRARGLRDPEEAWHRVREARHLRGPARSVAREIAAWRERRAAELNVPTRHVLSDLAIAAIAQRAPATEAELHKLRGVEDRFLRPPAAEQLLHAVQVGLAATEDTAKAVPRTEVPKELRAAVSLLASWVSQRARDLAVDAALLATRNDLEELLADVEGARLAEGWRAELIGAQIRALVSGEASLAFDGKGQLLLEMRSGTDLD